MNLIPLYHLVRPIGSCSAYAVVFVRRPLPKF